MPDSAPMEEGEQWKLPETPLEIEDEVEQRSQRDRDVREPART